MQLKREFDIRRKASDKNQKVVNTRTARLAAATPRIDTMASESGFPASRRPFAIKDVPRPWIVPKDPVYVGSENQLAESLSNRISNHISIQLDREQRFNSVTESDFSDIEIIEPLGQGSFGVVHLAKTKKNGFFALKELEPGTSGKAIETEISVLALGKTHPFINQIYFVTKSQDRTYLGLEYLCGGDLWYHLSLGPFTESRIRFYMAEIVLGLQILHGHGIVHRDLNLCNIILDAEGHVKLADFGLSIEGVTQGEKPAKSRCGTLGYMAPEVGNGVSYGCSADWWSVGVCLAEMLSFCPVPPNLIQMDSSWFLQNLPENVSKEAKNLLDNLLQQDPCDRLGCNLETDGEEALRRHEFFKALDWGKMERREVPAPFVPDSDSQKSSKYFNSTYML